MIRGQTSTDNEISETHKNPTMITEKLHYLIRILRRLYLKWSVQHPILSMALVILACVTILPIITTLTLMPIALLFTYSGNLASQGIFYVMHKFLIQGVFLGMVIVGLFIVGFVLVTSLSVLHSYRFFKKVPFTSND